VHRSVSPEISPGFVQAIVDRYFEDACEEFSEFGASLWKTAGRGNVSTRKMKAHDFARGRRAQSGIFQSVYVQRLSRGANAIYSAFIRAVCEKRHFTSDGWRLVSPRRGSEEGKQSERKGKRRQKKKRESERE
jgi:hypothetical protein